MLIVFRVLHFLNSLFFRRIENTTVNKLRNANIKTTTRLNARVSTYYVKIGLPVKVKGSQLRPVGKEVV